MKRLDENPLIRPTDVKPSRLDYEVIGAFNPGVARCDGQVVLLLRVAERPADSDPDWVAAPIWKPETGELDVLRVRRDDPDVDDSDPRIFRYRDQVYLTSISHLRLARSDDGIHFSVDDQPALTAQTATESFGLEDPRITQIGETYWITYKAVSEHGIMTALAETRDFVSFTRHGAIFCPENLDVVIFPERIGGQYAALTRPVGHNIGLPTVWLAKSPDLLHWGAHEPVLCPRPGMWDGGRVGASCVPIRTEQGWLEIYHGADAKHRYCVGAALLHGDNPAQVLARSNEPLMWPQAEYELEGFFDQVLFPSGADVRGDGALWVYYGASDELTCAATATVDELLGALNA